MDSNCPLWVKHMLLHESPVLGHFGVILTLYFLPPTVFHAPQRLYHGAMQFSDVSAGMGGEDQPYYLPRVVEEVEISDNMAVISVPPPRFRSERPRLHPPRLPQGAEAQICRHNTHARTRRCT